MTEELTFEGRVAIVTGAGGGLGRSYARLLARRGAHVVVNDLGGSVSGMGADTGAAAAVVSEIEAEGGVAVGNTDSVATPEGARSIVATAVDAFGRLDIVVNNAGILRDRSMQKMTVEDFRSVVDVHLLGTFLVTNAAYPLLRDHGYGRIVNTTSGAGLFGNFGQVNYAAAKMGIVGLSKALAVEGVTRNVRVNVIGPGALSRMTDGLGIDGMERMRPELVAPVVAWLCHDSCPLTGQVFSALGGRVSLNFVGETRGIWAPDLTVEEVAARIDEITSLEGSVVPEDLAAVMGLFTMMADSAMAGEEPEK